MRDFLTIKNAADMHQDGRQSRIQLDITNDFNTGIKKNLWRLKRLLIQKRRPFFVYDCLEGVLDSSRFTRVVTDPMKYDYYKQKVNGEIRETCVTFVVDPMCFSLPENRPIITSTLDVTMKMFEQASINSELYGYDGKYIIKYKNAFEKWNKAKESISLLLLVEPEILDNWDIALRAIILQQKKYFEDNRILFFISPRPVNYNTYLYALKNRVHYEHFDTINILRAKEMNQMLLKKFAEMFRLKFRMDNS